MKFYLIYCGDICLLTHSFKDINVLWGALLMLHMCWQNPGQLIQTSWFQAALEHIVPRWNYLFHCAQVVGDTTHNLSFRALDLFLCISLCWAPFVPSFLCFTKEVAEAGTYNSVASLDWNSWSDLIQDKVREKSVKAELSIPTLPCTQSSFLQSPT